MNKISKGVILTLAFFSFGLTFISCGSSSTPSTPAASTPTGTPTITSTPTATPLPTALSYKTVVTGTYNPEGIGIYGTTSYVSNPGSSPNKVIIYSSWVSVGVVTSYGSTNFGGNINNVQVDPRTGNFYVLDPSNGSVFEFTSAGVTVAAITSYGATSFINLSGLSVAPNGNVYVVDGGAGYVYEYTSAGATVTSWYLLNANTVAVSPLSPFNVYVGTIATSTVNEYSASGTSITSWGGVPSGAGVGNGKFEKIDALAVGPDGNVYVADGESSGGANKDDFIQEFSASGTFYAQWGGTGAATGQLEVPEGIAFSGGDVYVADSFNNRVEVFGP